MESLRKLFADRIPGQSDLCCYWFEKARAQIKAEKCVRAGLLATQGIRGGANRVVLKRIKESGDIFFAIFETFPFPEATESQRETIGAAARELNALRERWLNPPEWTCEEILEFPATLEGPWADFVDPNSMIARYPRLVPIDVKADAELKKRTLTKLYNLRPAWLAHAHAALDAAVAEAYGFAPDLPEREILAKLLERNLDEASKDAPHAKISKVAKG